MSGGYVLPVSYCDIGLGMSMFRDSQHYFAMVSKNVEGYAELSAEFDDGEFLTDDELYGQMDRLLSRYGASAVLICSRRARPRCRGRASTRHPLPVDDTAFDGRASTEIPPVVDRSDNRTSASKSRRHKGA